MPCHPPVHLRSDQIREGEAELVPTPRAQDADLLFGQAGMELDEE